MRPAVSKHQAPVLSFVNVCCSQECLSRPSSFPSSFVLFLPLVEFLSSPPPPLYLPLSWWSLLFLSLSLLSLSLSLSLPLFLIPTCLPLPDIFQKAEMHNQQAAGREVIRKNRKILNEQRFESGSTAVFSITSSPISPRTGSSHEP
jgi:hypothetical protein